MKNTSNKFVLMLCLMLILFSGCTNKAEGNTSALQMYKLNNKTDTIYIDDNYRTTYEICPYSFYDTNNDGIGDLNGITEKLDYIHDEMGFDEIWLTPINEATSYHKYDVIDYKSIDSDFGVMEDFENLVNKAHEKNTNIIIDLVINHTSYNHPWFKEASEYLKTNNKLNYDECKYLAYYNFSSEKKNGYEKLEGTDYYYEARFWSGMPDLNLDNGEVRNEIKDIISFWLDKGVDGFRLDATTSYYTDSKTDTIAFLSWINETVKSIKKDAYIVGEAWSSVDLISDYYTSGIDSFFNFPFADSNGIIAKTIKGSNAYNYGNMLEYTEKLYSSKSSNYIDAPFYTNHDMARSAGYYSGENSESQTKLAGALNLLMGGNVFVYYGEEIGMKGSGNDPNKRLPMRWFESGEGLCDKPEGATGAKDKYDTLDIQETNDLSILNYYKAAIRLRNTYPIIARGKVNFISELSNDDICVIEKVSDNYDSLLIVINTSSETKEVDLSSLDYSNLTAVLNVSKEEVELNGSTLVLPGYNIGLLLK